MPVPTLSAAPPAPNSANRATFDTYGDAFLAYVAGTFNTELNAVITAFNAALVTFNTGITQTFTGNSATSHNVVASGGAVAMTWPLNLGYQPGQYARVARVSNPSVFMVVRCTTYNSATGAFVGVCQLASAASGPFTDWAISPSFGPGPLNLTGTASLIWSAITTQNVATRTISVPGAVVGDAVTASPDGALGTSSNGIVLVAVYVSAADTVTVMVRNTQSTSQTPPTLNWKAAVIR